MILADHPINARWPAAYPDRLQLYSAPSPNGVKVSIALEELALPYEAHHVDIFAGENRSPAFVALNPNGKIPAIVDPDGPGGETIVLAESNAILHYLAEKTGRLIPLAGRARYETIQWMYLQASSIGPMFGQVGFFHKFAGRDIEDKRPRDRYADESRRLLQLLEERLAERTWMMGNDFTMADIAMIGWVRNLVGFYDAGALVDYAALRHVPAWLDRSLARPAVKRGLQVPERP